ncbi:ParB/RepB/Spo0J family partition protein [Oscillibacter sp.]|uniref:ParB/RepB/Spo0J family partition protein n=1 Tax=Oscillibacter sp. TaxID=1945593 RepID=UPI00289DF053|nr:ParB/RepB/Spo0J family partition protein [Oscillibacter sp.]
MGNKSNDALDRLFAGTPYFPGQESPTEPTTETVQQPVAGDALVELPINLLRDFATGMEKQPFRPYSQEDLEALRKDIINHGIIQPLIVRPLGNHQYEIIAGHNRRIAARAAGYTVVPCLVRNLSDDEAIMQMISTNLQQRKNLLPSEKAFAYKMQLAAMNRQGMRTDLTSSQLATKSERIDSASLIGDNSGESRDTVFRYIRLTYLTPELLQAVDEKKLGLTIGATLSFLFPENRQIVENFCFQERSVYISQELADRLREAESGGAEFTPEMLEELVQPRGKNLRKVTLPYKTVRRYFSEETTQEEIETTIQQALKLYFERKK